MRRPALCFAQGAAPPAARFGEAETRGRSPRKPPQAAGGGRNSHPVPTTPLQGKAAKKSAGFLTHTAAKLNISRKMQLRGRKNEQKTAKNGYDWNGSVRLFVNVLLFCIALTGRFVYIYIYKYRENWKVERCDMHPGGTPFYTTPQINAQKRSPQAMGAFFILRRGCGGKVKKKAGF